MRTQLGPVIFVRVTGSRLPMGTQGPAAQTLPTFLPFTPLGGCPVLSDPRPFLCLQTLLCHQALCQGVSPGSPVQRGAGHSGPRAHLVTHASGCWHPSLPFTMAESLEDGELSFFFSFFVSVSLGSCLGPEMMFECEWMRWERKHSDNLGLTELVGVLCRRWGWVGVLAQSSNAWRINASSLEGCACCRLAVFSPG